jgi:biopolymer transport protein ExbB
MSDPAILDRMTLWRIFVFLVLLATAWGAVPAFRRASAQQAQPEAPAVETPPADQAERLADAERRAQAALAAEQPKEAAPASPKPATSQITEKINLWELYLAGGVLMVPITMMSFIAVAFGIERALGLRRRKILPPRLLGELERLAAQKGGLDPRQAFRLCQQYPSTAANVIRSMLLKIGRPASELEHAVAEANEREAARLYSNVRWLNLCTTVTPLMGLLGTVQGMIQAFFVTAHLPVGANKAESLAQGIYVALVTTFGGLTVAIPAAMLSHFFEGRIQRLFRDLDEVLLGLLPQFQRFEGKVQVGGKDPLVDYELEPVAPNGRSSDPLPPRPAATT